MPSIFSRREAPSPWLGLIVICVAMFVSGVDMTIVNVALAAIGRDLGATINDQQWIMDGFLVALASLLLVGSGLADHFGRRLVFLCGLAGFAAASGLATVANDPTTLIIARVLMGATLACVMPPALSLLAVMFEAEQRPRAVGIWSGIAGIAVASGPVLGGILVETLGWRWVFLVNVPVCAVAIPFGLALLPESRRPGAPPIDIVGVALSMVGLAGIVIALIEGAHLGWDHPIVPIAAVVGVAAVAAFFKVERRRTNPLFDVSVLRRPAVSSGAVTLIAMYATFLGVLFLLPQYLEYIQDRSSLISGIALLPLGVLLGVVSFLSRRILAALGARWTVTGGLLIMAVGSLLLQFIGFGTPLALVLLAAGTFGGGLGMAIAPATAVILNDLGVAHAGDGGAVNQLSRQVGGALGIAIVGSTFAALFASRIDDAFSAVSAGAREIAEQSINNAERVAGEVGGGSSATLLVKADEAFDTAARAGFGVCTAILVGAAIATWVGLRDRAPARAGEEFQAQSPPSRDGGSAAAQEPPVDHVPAER